MNQTMQTGAETDVAVGPLLPAAADQSEPGWVPSATRSVYTRLIKPVTDIVAALLLAVLLLPVFLIISITIMIKLGRPILLHQERVGLGGRYFSLLKFRTMSPDQRRESTASGYQGVERRKTHKSPEDPRHTPAGRRLRKYGLDELPQLWNIIRGDMSLIGPRPELPAVVRKQYETSDHRRNLVKPGLTGLWQVKKRGEGRLMYEDIETDIDYIETISLRTDLAIAFATVMNLVRRKNVGS